MVLVSLLKFMAIHKPESFFNNYITKYTEIISQDTFWVQDDLKWGRSTFSLVSVFLQGLIYTKNELNHLFTVRRLPAPYRSQLALLMHRAPVSLRLIPLDQSPFLYFPQP